MQRLPHDVQLQLKKLGIHVELMDSVNAMATFNVLNEEGRTVIAALLPLNFVGQEKQDPSSNFSLRDAHGSDDILGLCPQPSFRAAMFGLEFGLHITICRGCVRLAYS